jgi:hypothetical protein
MTYLYINNNGYNDPASAGYLRKCTVKCTSFVLKTMRSFACSLMQTIAQTMYQPIVQTMCEPIAEPIAIFARHSARDLTRFDATDND